MSSHKGSHKGATPTQEQEKLTRTLTSLNIATFEPMLPPTLDKRSQTFIGQKRPSQLRAAQNQYTTVSIEYLYIILQVQVIAHSCSLIQVCFLF